MEEQRTPAGTGRDANCASEQHSGTRDASRFCGSGGPQASGGGGAPSGCPRVVKAAREGREQTAQGTRQAVAVTADGKLVLMAAPTRYDYDAKKELFDTFVQVVDIEANPPKLVAKLD